MYNKCLFERGKTARANVFFVFRFLIPVRVSTSVDAHQYFIVCLIGRLHLFSEHGLRITSYSSNRPCVFLHDFFLFAERRMSPICHSYLCETFMYRCFATRVFVGGRDQQATIRSSYVVFNNWKGCPCPTSVAILAQDPSWSSESCDYCSRFSSRAQPFKATRSSFANIHELWT